MGIKFSCKAERSSFIPALPNKCTALAFALVIIGAGTATLILMLGPEADSFKKWVVSTVQDKGFVSGASTFLAIVGLRALYLSCHKKNTPEAFRKTTLSTEKEDGVRAHPAEPAISEQPQIDPPVAFDEQGNRVQLSFKQMGVFLGVVIPDYLVSKTPNHLFCKVGDQQSRLLLDNEGDYLLLKGDKKQLIAPTVFILKTINRKPVLIDGHPQLIVGNDRENFESDKDGLLIYTSKNKSSIPID